MAQIIGTAIGMVFMDLLPRPLRRKSLAMVGLALALFPFLVAPSLADSGLQRLTLRNEQLGLEAVGRVELGQGSFCSGVLITPSQVLTAGHCLFKADGTVRDLSGFQFRAGLRDGQAVAQASVRRAVAHPKYDRLDTDRARAIRYDVALLELAEPIPAGTAAPFVVDRLSANKKTVSVVSYAAGRAEAASWQRDCALLARHTGVMVFSCVADFGASGAPVFAKIAGRYRVVSIISSGTQTEDETLVFGMELPEVLDDLRAGLRRGSGVLTLTRGPQEAQVFGAGAHSSLSTGMGTGLGTELNAGLSRDIGRAMGTGGAKFLRP